MRMKMVKYLALSAALMAAPAVTTSFSYTLEGMSGTIFQPSAQPLGNLGLVVSAGAFGHQDESMIRYNTFLIFDKNKNSYDTSQIQDLQSAGLRLDLALGIGRHLEIGVSAPYFGDFISDTDAKGLSGTGFGDPILAAKESFTLAGNHLFDVAWNGSVTIPTKSKQGFLPKQGAYMRKDTLPSPPRYFSSFAPGGALQFLMTLDLSKIEESPPPFRATLGTGLKHSGLAGTDPRFSLGGALEWLAMPNLAFIFGAQSETRLAKLEKLTAIGQEYSFAHAGFSAEGDDGIFFAVSIQKSLPSRRPFRIYEADMSGQRAIYASRFQPRLAFAANLGWSGTLVAADDDKDGIPDRDDLCPRQGEDFDGFQDMDGCPEIDNDGDSIPDVMDKCPMEQEDLDGFEDQDGCPEPDNDKDGILDALDKCPSEPEDMDSFEDYDGCPELDNDKDGVPDAQDKCPTLTEDMDGFEDTDGCPEPDNDQDKIPDLNDKCPNEAESYNGFEDGDGCPDMSRSMLNTTPLEKRLVLKGVHFQGNTDALLPGAYAGLDTLAERIRAVPGVMVEIRGFWDAGGSELEGFRNSENRANAVRKYLVGKGVESNQILARGMGSREPLASNKTASGRQQNRRVELHRLN
jgi:outer membrane protein OmpA-like peptidoglycan-associated protein